MSEVQAARVLQKVKYIGAARCDICERMRPECVEIPLGFFGVFSGCLCDSCVSLILRMFGRDQ